MRRMLIAVIAMLLTLTACTEIATTGPVEEVPISIEPKAVDIAPEPPAVDIVPSRLVEGFLQAMADPDGSYEVARQYLTPEAAADWDPGHGIVYQGDVVGTEDSATVSGVQIGRLDGVGHYTAIREEFEHNFHVQLVDGQWRISNPPDGVLLSQYLFSRYYRRVSLYYMSRAASHVVPDRIHVPEALVTPEVLVEALLHGPSEGMERTVSNEIPRGVTLGSGGATIDSAGVVTVDLEGLSPLLSDDSRRKLGAQLLWSLTAVPRTTGLIVTSDGQHVGLPGANANGILELSGQQGYQVLSRVSTSDLFGVRNSLVGRLAGSDVFERVSGVPGGVGDLAVSIDGTSVALLNQDRTVLSVGPVAGQVAPVETGLTNLSNPQFVLGNVWLLGDGPDGAQHLVVVDRNRNVKDVPITGLGIKSFAVSPTQARIALILGDGETSVLGIAPILSSGAALGHVRLLPLTGPTGAALTDLQAVAWQAEASLAMVATGGVRSVYTTQIDGSLVEDLGSVAGEVVEMTAMSRLGGGSIAVRSSSGIVWRYEARTRWTKMADGLSAIAFGA